MRIEIKRGFWSVGLLGLGLGLAACANNLFQDFPDKQSDDYRLDSAKNLLNAFKFDEAIEAISPVLEHRPKDVDVVHTAASAYAGRAGLRVIDLGIAVVEGISENKGLMEVFAEHYVQADADDIADIEKAVEIIEVYGARGVNRSSNMNLFSLFLFYSRIGVVLNSAAYNDNNVFLRAPFDACHTVEDKDAVKTGLTNDHVDIIMTSLKRISDTIAYIEVAGDAIDSLTSVSDLLDTYMPGAGFDPLPCSDDPTNTNCRGVRSLVNAGPDEAPGSFGLGAGEGACVTLTP